MCCLQKSGVYESPLFPCCRPILPFVFCHGGLQVCTRVIQTGSRLFLLGKHPPRMIKYFFSSYTSKRPHHSHHYESNTGPNAGTPLASNAYTISCTTPHPTPAQPYPAAHAPSYRPLQRSDPPPPRAIEFHHRMSAAAPSPTTVCAMEVAPRTRAATCRDPCRNP